MFMYFLYNLHPLFRLKVPEILFSNLWFFPHVDNHLFQDVPSKLAESRSDVGIKGHVELHPLVRGAAITTHHATEVLVGAKGLDHVLHHWQNVVVSCGGVCRRFSVPLRLPCRIIILLFWSTLIISSLLFVFIFFHSHNFNFFIQTQNFENKRISLEVFKIFKI